jgi:hypothetical protein
MYQRLEPLTFFALAQRARTFNREAVNFFFEYLTLCDFAVKKRSAGYAVRCIAE